MAEFFEMPDAEETVVEQTSILPDPVEEDALSVFNREWALKLEAKKAAEQVAEKKSAAEASEEMSNWLAQRDIRLSAKKETNRSEEQVYLEQQESDLDGNTWDRVTKLIDVVESSADENGKSDVSRMRKLFIQLKNEPLEQTRSAGVEA